MFSQHSLKSKISSGVKFGVFALSVMLAAPHTSEAQERRIYRGNDTSGSQVLQIIASPTAVLEFSSEINLNCRDRWTGATYSRMQVIDDDSYSGIADLPIYTSGDVGLANGRFDYRPDSRSALYRVNYYLKIRSSYTIAQVSVTFSNKNEDCSGSFFGDLTPRKNGEFPAK